MNPLAHSRAGIVQRALSAIASQFALRSTYQQQPAELDSFVGQEDVALPASIVAVEHVSLEDAGTHGAVIQMLNPSQPATPAAPCPRSEQYANNFRFTFSSPAPIRREGSSSLSVLAMTINALNSSHATRLPALQFAAPKVSPAPLDMAAGVSGVQPWDAEKMALVYWGSAPVNNSKRV